MRVIQPWRSERATSQGVLTLIFPWEMPHGSAVSLVREHRPSSQAVSAWWGLDTAQPTFPSHKEKPGDETPEQLISGQQFWLMDLLTLGSLTAILWHALCFPPTEVAGNYPCLLPAPSSVVLEVDACSPWIISKHARPASVHSGCLFPWQVVTSSVKKSRDSRAPWRFVLTVSVSICQGSHCRLAVYIRADDPDPYLIVLKRRMMNFSLIISTSIPTWYVLEALESKGLIYFWRQLGGSFCRCSWWI